MHQVDLDSSSDESSDDNDDNTKETDSDDEIKDISQKFMKQVSLGIANPAEN